MPHFDIKKIIKINIIFFMYENKNYSIIFLLIIKLLLQYNNKLFINKNIIE